MDKKKRSKVLEIVLGLIFIILGIFALNRPVLIVTVLVVWFGILSILRGITTIVGIGAYGESGSRVIRILIGIVDLIVGFIFVSNIVKGAFWLGFIFAFWFLVECIGNLFLTARFSESKGIARIGILLLDIICLILAVLLILNPFVVTLTLPILVGTFSILYGVVQLFQGIRI